MKLKKVFLNKDNLLKIRKIDEKFYLNTTPSVDWYMERYNENHYAYCLFDDNNMIGYIVSVPVKKELYESITNGVLLNDFDINPKMFLDNSDYNYIISCVINEEYQNQRYGSMLLEAVLNDFKNCFICALTISKGGYELFKNKMNLKMKLNDNVYVFENIKENVDILEG